jgi:hypothetical protein
MKVLIAADSASSSELLVRAIGVRPWPDDTTVQLLSVVCCSRAAPSTRPDRRRSLSWRNVVVHTMPLIPTRGRTSKRRLYCRPYK